jgi:hypothetical protein
MLTKKARNPTYLPLHGHKYNVPSYADAADALRSAHRPWKQTSMTTLVTTRDTLTRKSFHQHGIGIHHHLGAIPRLDMEGHDLVYILRMGVLHKGGAIVLTYQKEHRSRLRSIIFLTQQTSSEPSCQ